MGKRGHRNATTKGTYTFAIKGAGAQSFDQGGLPEFDGDIPTLASLLKLFLRELPGVLIPEPHVTKLLKVFRGK